MPRPKKYDDMMQAPCTKQMRAQMEKYAAEDEGELPALIRRLCKEYIRKRITEKK